jgi:hypothetical protein
MVNSSLREVVVEHRGERPDAHTELSHGAVHAPFRDLPPEKVDRGKPHHVPTLAPVRAAKKCAVVEALFGWYMPRTRK